MARFDQHQSSKYTLDQEQQFRSTNRRNKLLGLWAAERMGLSGDAAEAYAREVVSADFEKPGDDDVIAKVSGDLKGKGIEVTAPALRAKLAELMAIAQKQVLEEGAARR